VLRWWNVLLFAVTCHAPPAGPATPQQRMKKAQKVHVYDFEDDIIEGDLVHPDGIID